MYLLLYVDDMLIASKNSHDIKRLKNLLKGDFKIKNLGNAKRILDIDIYRDRVVGTLFLSQDRYVDKFLNMFGMLNSKPFLTLLGAQFKLSDEMSPKSKVERL